MKTILKIIVAPFKLVATLITILLMLAAALLLLLAGYFTFRASQPLSRPEYSGLTYFQYIQFREWAHNQNPRMISMQSQYPEEELSCAGLDRYDDALLFLSGLHLSSGNPGKAWVFFEDALYQVDFEGKGLRFGQELGCELPLASSIPTWQHQSETSSAADK